MGHPQHVSYQALGQRVLFLSAERIKCVDDSILVVLCVALAPAAVCTV